MSANESEQLSDALHALRLLLLIGTRLKANARGNLVLEAKDHATLTTVLALANKIVGQDRAPSLRKVLRQP